MISDTKTMARAGGLGIVHKNLGTERQAAEVLKVKRSESRFIEDPVTITPDMRITAARALMREKNISGLPVLDGNKLGKRVGLGTDPLHAAELAVCDVVGRAVHAVAHGHRSAQTLADRASLDLRRE